MKPQRYIAHHDEPAAGWGAVRAVGDILYKEKNMGKDVVIMIHMNKPGGFDCPGCAWPDSLKDHHLFELCENGVKAMAWEATSKRTTPAFFAEHTVTELMQWSDMDLEDHGRLTHPMKYNAATDKYEPIEWEVAFAEIGELLQSYDPKTVEFYTSGRTSNEAAFLFQIFGRELGHNNFPDCSNMCHEPTSEGLPPAIGVGKATIMLDDLLKCDLYISMGHNPGTNHPRILTSLEEMAKRGTKIVAINPMTEQGLVSFLPPQNPVQMIERAPTPIATHYYHVRVGGDAAFLKGVMRLVIERHEASVASGQGPLLDVDFIENETAGYEALRADVLATDWDKLIQDSGLAKEAFEELAQLYIESNATIIAYGMGMTQHERGTQNIQQMVNLLLLKGNIGKPGAGISPIRGHSNVQGDRTVGITEKPSKALIDAIEKLYGFRAPEEWGHAAVASLQALSRDEVNAMIFMGGNLLYAMPDHSRSVPAMRRLPLAVHIATKLNRSHLVPGKHTYLFPTLGRTEIDRQASGPQQVTVEDSMSMVHASSGRLEPASPYLKSECAIVAGLAKAAIPNTRVPWDEYVANYDRIRDAIETIYPIFEGYNEKIKQPGGFHLYNAAEERVWHTPNGRANFIVMAGDNEDPTMMHEAAFRLATIRSHDQYNTTIYGMNDRYRGVFGMRNVLFLSQAEANRLGFEEGDKVKITALDAQGQKTERSLDNLIVVYHNMGLKSAATYFPEANDLIDLDNFDPIAGIPAYKNVPIVIERSQLPDNPEESFEIR